MKVSKVTSYLLCGMILAAGILFFVAINALAEDVTITTYYPAPYGVYGELKATESLTVGEEGTTSEPVTSTTTLYGNVAILPQNQDAVSGLEGGNVGIGTTSPNEQLEITSKAIFPYGIWGGAIGDIGDKDIWGISSTFYPSHSTSTSQYGIKWNNAEDRVTFVGYGVERAWVDLNNGDGYFDGKVGIGTASPDYKLEVDGTADFGSKVTWGDGAQGSISGSNDYFYVYANANRALSLGAGGGVAMLVITEAGNVSITGNLTVGGQLTKGSGAFLIDHPLDPANKVLRHSFIEGPEPMLMYKGRAKLENGQAVIQLPDYFDTLNHPEGREINLTCIGGWSPLYLDGEVSGNTFVVKTTAQGNSQQEFSWVVYAVRNDAFIQKNPIIVEEEKGVGNEFSKGEYLHPEAFGIRLAKE